MDQSFPEEIAAVYERLSSSDSEEAKRAADELVHFGLEALPNVIRALGDPSTNSEAHGQLLWRMDDLLKEQTASAIPELLRFLDPATVGSECASYARLALASIGEQALAPLLAWARKWETIVRLQLGEMFKAGDADMQVKVLQCYRKFARRPGVEVYREFELLQDEDHPPHLRRQAAATSLYFSLRSSTDRRLAIIREGLQDSEDPYHWEYLDTIKRHGTKANILAPSIEPFMQRDNPLCQLAIETYGAIGGASSGAIKRLTTCLETSSDEEVRKAATEGLGRIAPSNSDALKTLFRALQDQDAYIQGTACRMLGRMGNQAAACIPDIEALARLGPCVPEALASIGTPEAIAALRRIYDACQQHRFNELLYPHDEEELGKAAHQELSRLGESID
jgi:HEAT repeat protein